MRKYNSPAEQRDTIRSAYMTDFVLQFLYSNGRKVLVWICMRNINLLESEGYDGKTRVDRCVNLHTYIKRVAGLTLGD